MVKHRSHRKGATEKVSDTDNNTSVDHRNAHAVVEAYIASGLAGYIAKAAALANAI
jgi:hypothetical protein